MGLGLVVGIIAAVAVVLIVLGVAGSGREDPLRARLNQLGAMTAKDLQELELQQPFFDRTVKPLAMRLSGAVARITSSSFTERTEKRLAMAGNPGDMRVSDWLGIKAIGAAIGGALFFLIVGILGQNLVMGVLLALVGLGIGYIGPEFYVPFWVILAAHAAIGLGQHKAPRSDIAARSASCSCSTPRRDSRRSRPTHR